MGRKPWPLFVTGQVGSCKTCTALLALDVYGGCYFTAAALGQRLASARCGELQSSSGYPISELELWAEWSGSNLCVLDELAARSRVTDCGYEAVYEAINRRHGLPLIAISNKDIGGIDEAYDDRIASRLAAGTIIETEGDRRLNR